MQEKHLIQIDDLSRSDIEEILALAETYLELNKTKDEQKHHLGSFTQINVFFENSTRTLASFELAGKKLGGIVQNIQVATSSVQKGETLIDTALTLNSMRPDLLVVRHSSSGAVNLLSEKVNCSVLNAGDGSHEHPTQALLDFLTIKYRKKKTEDLIIAICGDIDHSRVARSNIALLCKFNNQVRLIGPSSLLPASFKDMGLEIYNSMEDGVRGADVIMMLRLQKERMKFGFIPSRREYFNRFGLDNQKLSLAKDNAIVMHPGPMNRGVEIDGIIADDLNRSVIQEQVEIGVALRMAVLHLLVDRQK
ncbi:aspartate carbamoyltransferase catalytic subunit [Paracoccaceae bacterium]|nr:aspartate carbamoyltransferase catalytic subunit [Paracoccaceae bacterium]